MDEISDVKPPKGFPHITDLTGSEATIFQVANAQGDILGYATMADIDSYIEKKVGETVHSFTEKQTFQDVTINGTFDGDNVVNKNKLSSVLADYAKGQNGTNPISDCNLAIHTGIYYFTGLTSNCPPASIGYKASDGSGTIYVSSYDENFVNQIVQDFYENGVLYFRTCYGGTWGEWKRIATKSDLLENYKGQAFNFANFVNDKIVKKICIAQSKDPNFDENGVFFDVQLPNFESIVSLNVVGHDNNNTYYITPTMTDLTNKMWLDPLNVDNHTLRIHATSDWSAFLHNITITVEYI